MRPIGFVTSIAFARVAVAVLTLGGTAYFANVVHQHYSIQDWFVWRWLLLVGYTLVFQTACVAVGARLLRRVIEPTALPLAERWLASMGLGLLVFTTAMYVAGALGLFVLPLAVALPLVMIAVGRRDGWALVTATADSVRVPDDASPVARMWRAASLVVGVIAIGLLYGIGFSPDAISFENDSTHWRYPQGGSSRSTSNAAPSPMRLPMHDGQKPRPLHEDGTRSCSPHRRHAASKKPRPKSPQVTKASSSSVTNAGSTPPSHSMRSRNAGRCRRTIATASQLAVVRGRYSRAVEHGDIASAVAASAKPSTPSMTGE